MSKPARMKAERARFLFPGEESEAGIGADVLAGDRRVAAGYGPYLLPWGNGFYMKTLTFDPAMQNEILRFVQDDPGESFSRLDYSRAEISADFG